jgi:tetratricopeptide (TPR) repeat protein
MRDQKRERLPQGRSIVLITLATILFIVFCSIWLLPAVLTKIPDRYVARLPYAFQQLVTYEQEDILPAPITAVDTGLLLATPVTPATALPTPFIMLMPGDDAPPSAAVAAPPSGSTAASPAATAVATATPLPRPTAARLDGFRHQFQTWNNCGPATLAMTLSYFGIQRSQQQTAAILKPDPEDRNVSPYEMVAYVNEQTDIRAIERTNGSLELLRQLLAQGIPVIIELGINPPGEYRWMGWYGHYLLIVAYDDDAAQVWVYDSWFGTSEEPGENATTEGRAFNYSDLDRQWREFNRNYIALYRPEQAATVAALIGPDMEDSAMWQRALTVAQAEVTAAPADAFLWFNLGTVYTALEEYEKATAAFDQARAIGLPWRMLWYQFAPYEAYYQTRRYEEVVLLADVTLERRPYFEESYYYRGLAQAALGNIAAARQNLESAVAFNPNFRPAAEALARINQ